MKKTIGLRMHLILRHGQYKESKRSNLFVKTRVKLQCAEQRLRHARKILGRTTRKTAKAEIKKSIVSIALGYRTLKSAIAELKSDAKSMEAHKGHNNKNKETKGKKTTLKEMAAKLEKKNKHREE